MSSRTLYRGGFHAGHDKAHVPVAHGEVLAKNCLSIVNYFGLLDVLMVPETGIEPVRPLFTKAADYKSAVMGFRHVYERCRKSLKPMNAWLKGDYVIYVSGAKLR